MKKCLIVDDEEQNRYLLDQILRDFGYKTAIAKNGAEALDNARQDPPDLIISDILMPVMDGYALCRECKSDDTLNQIPFIFYTATYTTPKDEAFALSLGAARFILKPQEPDILMNIIKGVIEEADAVKQVAIQPLGDEMEFFRQHNEILLKKLEKKILDLETANQKLKCLEEQYRLSLENVTDIVWTIDADFIVRKMSPSVEKMLGYKAQDFIGQSIIDLLKILTPESTERAMAEMRLVLGGQTIPVSVYSLVAKDRTIKYGEISGSPILRSGGKIVGMISVIRDITDRKQAEEALQENRDILDEVGSIAKIGGWEMDLINRKATWTQGTYEIVEIEPGQPIPGPDEHVDYYLPEYRPMIEEAMRALIEDDKPLDFGAQLRTAKGNVKWCRAMGRAIRKEGKAITVYGTFQDITERKQAEEALRKSEEYFRAITENANDVLFIVDEKGNITYCSLSVERIVGYKPQELIGLNALDLIIPEDHAKANKDFGKALRIKDIGIQNSFRIRHKNGTVLIMEGVGKNLFHNPVVAGFVMNIRDVSDRRQAEEKLRKSEASFQELFNEAPVGYFEYDNQGCITRVNQTELDMLGYSSEEMIGQPVWKFIVDEELCRPQILAKLAGTLAPSKGFERMYRRKDGAILPVLIQDRLIKDGQGNITGIRCTVQDITERKQAEKQLCDTLESLRKAFGTTIQVMVSAVETRDPYTAGHQIRSADLARAIATEMGLPQKKIEGIRMASSIHDIGKLSTPTEILTKPVKLTEIELSLIKEHSRQGYEMLKDVESPWPLAQIVYQHHERMDGSGYPRKLKGDEILIEARILAIADVVESMASHRPYRPALGLNAALEEIEKNKGTLYDADAVDTCLRLFREKNFKIEET
jgi:PAS domain S-box-containing protein